MGLNNGRTSERTLARLTSHTLTDSCYQVLKDAILNLDLEPGQLLLEQQIARELGISKTPVREALAKLSSENFVINTPARKTIVAGLSDSMIKDIYAVRLLLEPGNARDVAQSIESSNVEKLQEIADRAEASFRRGETRSYLEGNREFHRFLIQLSRNQLLLSTYDGIYDHSYRTRAAIYRSELESKQQEYAEHGFAHHNEIVDALRRRDPNLAADRMRADIGRFLELAHTPAVSKAIGRLGVPQDSL